MPNDKKVIELDVRAWEDLRIGELVARELGRGGCWHKKDGTSVDMSFSATLLEYAGGIGSLLREWTPEKGSALWNDWLPR